MTYVVRILDSNGKLKKERIMFYAVRVLDDNGNLIKLIKSKILSQRHWKAFPDCLRAKRKTKNYFNAYGKAKSHSGSIRSETY